MIALLVALAGGAGSATRFVVDGLVHDRNRTGFPLGTPVINVTGSFLLGLLTGWAVAHGGVLGPELRAVLGTGFLGGYTTFSTSSVETARLARAGRWRAAALHGLGQLGVALGAAGLGLWLGSL